MQDCFCQIELIESIWQKKAELRESSIDNLSSHWKRKLESKHAPGLCTDNTGLIFGRSNLGCIIVTVFVKDTKMPILLTTNLKQNFVGFYSKHKQQKCIPVGCVPLLGGCIP